MAVPALSTPENLALAALAACAATTFSNPAEVAKTRLQLQGELVKEGGRKVYSNVIDVLKKTSRNEGLRGVQRGLIAAYMYSSILQSCILGLYEPFRRAYNRQLGFDPRDRVLATSVIAGTSTGVVGAIIGNPFFLVKARMQAYSPSSPVGTQRYYRTASSALLSIWRTERLRGLTRGVDAAMLRTSMGTSVQMPTYYWAKNLMVSNGFLEADHPLSVVLSSAAAGVAVCMSMQPADTVLTRLYNQPTQSLPDGRTVGLLYKNPLDCLWKIVRTEGPLALYKGSTAHFFRIAPHVTIILSTNDLFTRLYRKTRAVDI